MDNNVNGTCGSGFITNIEQKFGCPITCTDTSKSIYKNPNIAWNNEVYGPLTKTQFPSIFRNVVHSVSRNSRYKDVYTKHPHFLLSTLN